MIDYSAFDEDKKNLKQYNGKLPGLPRVSNPLTVMLVLFGLIFLGLSPIIFSSSGIFGGIIILACLAFVAYKIPANGQEISIRTALFASRNKFGYSWKGGKYKQLSGLGSVLGEPMKSNVVSGHFYGQSFTISGVYTDKLFKNVMRVELPNKYPHIIMDSKQNDRVFSSLQTIFPSNKEIVLEGNFPDYFRVFTATTPIETLQILSPELMGRIIDYSYKVDIEILEDQLLLIGNFKLIDKKGYEMLFAAVEQILKDLGVNANNSKVKFDSKSRV